MHESIDHLDIKTKHVVYCSAYPSMGKTAYIARCRWCGESICLRNEEYFRIRLETFREETCSRVKTR